MGSRSSSASSSQTNNRNSSQSLVDSSQGDGDRQNIAIGGDITGSVTLTDNGAIKAAESVSERAFSFASGASTQASDLANSALKTVKESTSESVGKFARLAEQVKTDGAAQTKKLIAGVALALILAATIVAVAVNWKKSK